VTHPDEGSAPEQEASTSSAGDTPVEPVETPVEPDAPEAPQGPTLEQQLAERTADLQRLQAEYVNYKRRVDRDRDLVLQNAIARAADHGELEGGFKAVADSLQQAVGKHKLEAFGAKGEPFDPSLHEAVFHAGESAEVDTTTIDTVMRTGYKIGDRVLRAATVGVVDPATTPAEPAASGDTEQDVLTDETPNE
jgi:molecular chaperone GrpE